jgi:hypothetical protein
MRVKFIKKYTIAGVKPFEVDFEYKFSARVAKDLYEKGLVEILQEHDFEAPKKAKKIIKKEDKETLEIK